MRERKEMDGAEAGDTVEKEARIRDAAARGGRRALALPAGCLPAT